MKHYYRKGIAMIMAIAVIIIIATIMALGLAMTTQTANRNLDMYLYEQAEILAHAAREYAMYKIGNTPCNESGFTFTQDNFYNVSITIRYVTSDGCTANPSLNYIPTTNTNHLDTNLIAPTAVINVTVSIDNSQTNTNENISFYKRYIEIIKPI